MIIHASFKHFLRYVRKMWILLNPSVNTREHSFLMAGKMF